MDFFFLNLPLCSKRYICRGKKKKKRQYKKVGPSYQDNSFITSTLNSIFHFAKGYNMHGTVCITNNLMECVEPKTSLSDQAPEGCKGQVLSTTKGEAPKVKPGLSHPGHSFPPGPSGPDGAWNFRILGTGCLAHPWEQYCFPGCKMSPNDTTFPNRSRQNKKQDTRLASEG